MNKPPPILIDTWLKISHNLNSYEYSEAREIARDNIFKHFETIREAEMYLYRTGFYGE